MVSRTDSPHREQEAFHAIKRERASGQIVEQLEAAILGGRFLAGDRLPTERELAERFGTSRSSVREALRSLEQAGLVVVRQGASGGAFVTTPGAKLVGQTLHRLARLGGFDSAQLYDARRLLEPGITAEAAEHAAADDVRRLEGIMQEIRTQAAEGKDTAEASRRFHLCVAEATGNSFMILLNAALLDVAERLDTAIERPPRPVHLTVDAHEALLDAIKRKDATRARCLAEDHLSELGRHAAAEQASTR